ncbi:hypothetical protein ACFFMP_12920 [Pseudoroseomonas cervicalis]|uniref:Uncharacterized protein n=1 Tax=Pseudoroseomonas cervicalis ATCC 49957 TaxID=525371 RepID=D5RK21_9PROT|nr:hypothetical protein [Pseudoroseomonas cervicalis]EFH12344.1 hypothetical protein HMPREF0731_1431 [Pseudoroseomonas cervicalis ATCC 49957]
MLRGAIESVIGNKISGWIYAPLDNFRGTTVLAFVDEECVGSGTVELYRPDLAAAGLGDGYLGFSFWVTLRHRRDAPRIVIRLEGSDAVLLQRQSRVVDGSGADATQGARLSDPPALMRWLRARGWLSEADFDLARHLPQFGVYDRSLVELTPARDHAPPRLKEVVQTAADLLRLVTLQDGEVEQALLAGPEELAGLGALRGGENGMLVALWSRAPGQLDIIPGSHRGQEEEMGGVMTLADHAVGPDRLLFLDTRCRIGPNSRVPAEGLQAFFIPAR